FHVVSPRVFKPRRVINHQPRRFELGCGLGQLKLHGLKPGDLLTKLPALLRIVDRVVEGTLRYSDHLSSDANSTFVERFNCYFVTSPRLPEDVLFLPHAVFEDKFASRARSYA